MFVKLRKRGAIVAALVLAMVCLGVTPALAEDVETYEPDEAVLTKVIDGAAEMTPEAPKELYDALDCPKTHLFFDEGTCGQLHSQMGAPLTSEEYVFDWVADNF